MTTLADDDDWDLPPPSKENERYSKMTLDELIEELRLLLIIDRRLQCEPELYLLSHYRLH